MTQADPQKNFFEIAYRTGTDSWTHIPYEISAKHLAEYLPKNALVLDLGSGRGRFPFELAKQGFRVIGLDYVKEVIDKNNDEVRLVGIGSQLRFMEGNVLDIPFTDSSFDAVTDFGVLQHLDRADWETYAHEVKRVLKNGGQYLSVELSRETPQYLTWIPKKSETGDFEFENVKYHFFTESEMSELFKDGFALEDQQNLFMSDREHAVFLVSRYRKNN